MADLVTSPEQVVDNILRYSADPGPLVDLMAMTRAWYAVKHGEGWLFGPSKFVGYADMTVSSYIAADYSHEQHGRVDASGTVMDGRITEGVIRNWAQPIEQGHPQFEEMSRALAAFCAKFGKKPNNRARMALIRDEEDDETEFGDDLVALMVAIYGRLSPAQQGAFRRAVPK